MKDQHTKISGYRDLTQEEVDLMNEAKQHEARFLAFWEKVENHIVQNRIRGGTEEQLRQDYARAGNWLYDGRADVEKGFMQIVRAIAQPQPTEIL